MSTQPMPEPIPVATGAFDPDRAQPAPSQRPRCRALTVDGRRCKNFVVGGLHLCFSHYRNRRPALPHPTRVSVPLLENHAAIQLVTTQVVQGLLSLRLDPLRARVALAALRIAALTLPRPARPSVPEAPEDSVCRLGRDHEDFISADGDLADPGLNPACSVPESVDAVRTLLDTLEPESHCDPELEQPDVPPVDPTHDHQRCPCLSCADSRADRAQWLEAARFSESAAG
jgi:hypothetical protein